jgi:hypothetical protein
MIKIYKTISKGNYLMLLPFLIFISLFLSSCSNQTSASDFPDCFVGTYINQVGDGAENIWNLYKDGNFAGHSSTEEVFNFSGQLGSWVMTDNREAEIVFLDFSFDYEGVKSNIARVDIDITFKGDNCEEIEGSFELRFFEDDEDPLDISSDDGEVIKDTFTGSKLLL